MSESDTTARQNFQDLLRELFQIENAAELDFGIYRIMGQKREIIERFIDEELVGVIEKELNSGATRAEAGAAEKLEELAAKVRELIADDAIDVEGNLAEEHHGTKLGREYLEWQKKAAGARNLGELEGTIYNHLYQFFSRYYDKGDFMSQRRYSKREKYAIPYNGEEVYLHWANADQYYIKSGETFTDYRWKEPSGKVRVRFSVTRADVPQDNIKAPDKRYFLPRLDDVTVETIGKANDPDRHTLVTVPFHYRGLTEEETERFETLAAERGITNGNGNGGKLQRAALAEAEDELPKVTAIKDDADVLSALQGEHHRDGDGEPVSRLAHHLRRFTVKNTSDYFIHKDLGGFLTRELDFYLKNEVLSLDSLEAGGEERAEGWFEMMRVMKKIGGTIIEFLAQIENFQKRIFEKKKFVTECHYCLTLDRVPEELYPEIAKNEAQIEEWKKLFAIDEAEGWSEPPTVEFLKENWNLVVDTGFFGQKFSEMLGETIGEPEGLLVNSENFQALNTTKERFREAINCIYIDPPYNTGSDGFPYKDNYLHSSWLAMLEGRLKCAHELLREDGGLFTSIDDIEIANTRNLSDKVFGAQNFLATVIWQKVFSPKNTAKYFSEDHDYLIVHAKSIAKWAPILLERGDEAIERYKNPDNDDRGPWSSSDLTARNYYSLGTYEVTSPAGKKFKPSVGNYWRVSLEKFKEIDNDNRIWWGQSNDSMPRLKRFLSEVKSGVVPQTLWMHTDVGNTQDAKKELVSRITFDRSEDVFNTVKPPDLIKKVVKISCTNGSIVLDFFAGSGTTAQAVIDLNRERVESLPGAPLQQYYLVEMGEYFETLVMPRVKKSIYAKSWNFGQPKKRDTGLSHCFKYLRLESYEDALANIAFDHNETAQRQLNFDEYVIHYMLAFETGGSETLLDTEKLVAPFDYKLEIRDGEDVTFKKVDLPETFNFLIGLRVRTRKVHYREVKKGRKKEKRKYLVLRGRTNPHATGGEREVVVIWRTTEGWKKEDFTADREFVEELELTKDADEVFVNDDSFIREAKSLDPVFKRKMFNED